MRIGRISESSRCELLGPAGHFPSFCLIEDDGENYSASRLLSGTGFKWKKGVCVRAIKFILSEVRSRRLG